MSQFLEYTKNDKNREKRNRKIIFRSDLSKTNIELTFRLHQKMTKNREKNSKIIFGSEVSEANNEPTFRIHQKNRGKNRKIIFGSEFSEMSQILEYTKKLTKNREKNIEKLFLVQNCLKRIMSQL